MVFRNSLTFAGGFYHRFPIGAGYRLVLWCLPPSLVGPAVHQPVAFFTAGPTVSLSSGEPITVDSQSPGTTIFDPVFETSKPTQTSFSQFFVDFFTRLCELTTSYPASNRVGVRAKIRHAINIRPTTTTPRTHAPQIRSLADAKLVPLIVRHKHLVGFKNARQAE